LPDTLTPLLGSGLRWLSLLCLLGLAAFFGRSLRRGATPLIERIARQSKPALAPAVSRYTRRLTALWCCYFIAAAVLTAASDVTWSTLGAGVWVGTLVLFVGERWMRPWFFPGETFPGLVQQVRDTWSVWRTRD
jgi:uncharacterized membrane protein